MHNMYTFFNINLIDSITYTIDVVTGTMFELILKKDR